jgi:hypothetical protein
MSNTGQSLDGQSRVSVLAPGGHCALLAEIGFMHHASAHAAFKGIEIPESLFCGKPLDLG